MATTKRNRKHSEKAPPTLYVCLWFVRNDVKIYAISSKVRASYRTSSFGCVPLIPDIHFRNIAKELKEKEENMSPTKYNVKNTFAESDRPKSTQERRSFVVEV